MFLSISADNYTVYMIIVSSGILVVLPPRRKEIYNCTQLEWKFVTELRRRKVKHQSLPVYKLRLPSCSLAVVRLPHCIILKKVRVERNNRPLGPCRRKAGRLPYNLTALTVPPPFTPYLTLSPNKALFPSTFPTLLDTLAGDSSLLSVKVNW